MLVKIRRYAGSFIFKIILILIAVSFIIWGVGDIIRNKRAIVAKVGSETIDYVEFKNHLNQELSRLQAIYGVKFTEEQTESLAINKLLLEHLVSKKLLELEAKNLGIIVSDETAYERISSNPSYFNNKNVFDKEIFRKILQHNGISEKSYIDSIKKEVSLAYLTDIFTNENLASDLMSKLIFQHRNLSKNVTTFSIDPKKVTLKDLPSEQNLQEQYEKSKKEHVIPEFRTSELIHLNSTHIQDIAVSEEEIKQEYQENSAEYLTPEVRSFYNVVLDSEEKMKKILAQCGNVTSDSEFQTCLKKSFDIDSKKFLLNGSFENLPKFIAEIAFVTEEKKFSDIFKSDYGHHLIWVSKVTKEQLVDFEKVKDEIKANILKQRSEDSLYGRAKQIEDEIASGATLQEIANKFSLKIENLAEVDKNGRMPNGKLNQLLPKDSPEVLKAIFEMNENDDASMIQGKENDYYIIKTSKIHGSRMKDFDEVKDDVINSWIMNKKTEIAEGILQDARKIAETGQHDVMKQKYPEISITKLKITRESVSEHLSADLIDEIFALSQNQTTNVHKEQNLLSFVLVGEQDPLKNPTAQEADEIRKEVNSSFANEFFEQYISYLKSKYKILIYI